MSHTYEIRNRNIGEVLDQAIFLFRDHIKFIAVVAGIFIFPLMMMADLLSQMMTPDPALLNPDTGLPTSISAEAMASMWALIAVSSLATGLLFLLAVSFANASIIHGIAYRYLGNPVPTGNSLRAGLRVLPKMILMQFVVQMAVGLGACACVIPGLIIAALFFLAPTVLVLERTTMANALARSIHLVRGSVWQVVALIVVVSIIGVGISGSAEIIPANLVYRGLYAVAETAFTAFEAVVAVVLYFAARCRVEHLDLDLLAEEVDVLPAAGEAVL